MNVTAFKKILTKIQNDSIDIHGEIIDFPAGNADQFLIDFERILLKYAIYRGCYTDDDADGVARRANKLKKFVNKGNKHNWGKLDWDAAQVTYGSGSARKHSISSYRLYVLGEMLRFLAQNKGANGKYNPDFTFDEAADKFLDLVKKNNVPQRGWNGAQSYLFWLSLVVADRKRAFELKVEDKTPVANEKDRLARKLEQEQTKGKKALEDLNAGQKTQIDRLLKDVDRLSKDKVALEQQLKEQQGVQVLGGELNTLRAQNEQLKAKIGVLNQQITEAEASHGEMLKLRSQELTKRVEALEKENRSLVNYANRLLKALQKLLEIVAKISPPLREKVLATNFTLRLGEQKSVPDVDTIYTFEADLLEQLSSQSGFGQDASRAAQDLRKDVHDSQSRKAAQGQHRSGFHSRGASPANVSASSPSSGRNIRIASPPNGMI